MNPLPDAKLGRTDLKVLSNPNSSVVLWYDRTAGHGTEPVGSLSIAAPREPPCGNHRQLHLRSLLGEPTGSRNRFLQLPAFLPPFFLRISSSCSSRLSTAAFESLKDFEYNLNTLETSLVLSLGTSMSESQNPSLVWVGRDFKAHPAPTPAMGRDTFH